MTAIGRAGERSWDDVAEGESLPTIADDISYRKVIMNTATTWDYFPGHHDPAYARAQGQPTIYVDTMHFMGFVDRLATDWGGPRCFVRRRRVALRHSIYAGDTMIAGGRVVAKRVEQVDGAARHLVDLEIEVTNQDGVLCCPATLTLEMPAPG